MTATGSEGCLIVIAGREPCRRVSSSCAWSFCPAQQSHIHLPPQHPHHPHPRRHLLHPLLQLTHRHPIQHLILHNSSRLPITTTTQASHLAHLSDWVSNDTKLAVNQLELITRSYISHIYHRPNLRMCRAHICRHQHHAHEDDDHHHDVSCFLDLTDSQQNGGKSFLSVQKWQPYNGADLQLRNWKN